LRSILGKYYQNVSINPRLFQIQYQPIIFFARSPTVNCVCGFRRNVIQIRFLFFRINPKHLKVVGDLATISGQAKVVDKVIPNRREILRTERCIKLKSSQHIEMERKNVKLKTSPEGLENFHLDAKVLWRGGFTNTSYPPPGSCHLTSVGHGPRTTSHRLSGNFPGGR